MQHLQLIRAILAVLCLTFGMSFGVSAQSANPTVKIQTSEGLITVELYPSKAPKTVENFLTYVREKHYDGTIFHRVISNFMIQGGGFTADMKEKSTHNPIPLESRNGLTNERGTVAMARTSVPDSATAQFFVNLVGNSFLDQERARDGNGYAVFGKVISGMEVVDKIGSASTTSSGILQNVPRTPILINSITLVK